MKFIGSDILFYLKLKKKGSSDQITCARAPTDCLAPNIIESLQKSPVTLFLTEQFVINSIMRLP